MSVEQDMKDIEYFRRNLHEFLQIPIPEVERLAPESRDIVVVTVDAGTRNPAEVFEFMERLRQDTEKFLRECGFSNRVMMCAKGTEISVISPSEEDEPPVPTPVRRPSVVPGSPIEPGFVSFHESNVFCGKTDGTSLIYNFSVPHTNIVPGSFVVEFDVYCATDDGLGKLNGTLVGPGSTIYYGNGAVLLVLTAPIPEGHDLLASFEWVPSPLFGMEVKIRQQDGAELWVPIAKLKTALGGYLGE